MFTKAYTKKKKKTQHSASSQALAYLTFTLHTPCKHIKPIPDGTRYINQRKFPIYIFTNSLGKKMEVHTGLMGGSAMCRLHQTDFINKVKTN